MRFWKAYAIALGFVVLCGAAVTFPNQILFQANGTGAAVRKQGAKVGEVVSVCDFIGDICPSGGDDTTAIQNAINTGLRVIVPPGTYSITGLTAVAGGALEAPDRNATFTLAAGSNLKALTIAVNNYTVRGIRFNGGNIGPYNTSGAVAGTRYGVYINGVSVAAGIQNVTVEDCYATGFDHTAFYVKNTAGASGGDPGLPVVNMIGNTAYTNYNGVFFDDFGEYVQFTNGQSSYAFAAIRIVGGNDRVLNSHFTKSYRNAMVRNGSNDSHNTFMGCSFNHVAGGGVGVDVGFANNGQIFVGNQIWSSSIVITDSKGTIVMGNLIGNSNITTQFGSGSTGSHIIANNWLTGTVTTTFDSRIKLIYKNNVSDGDTGGGEYWLSAQPSSGTWQTGDRVWNSAPSIGNPSAWLRLTTGSGNVAGTDWTPTITAGIAQATLSGGTQTATVTSGCKAICTNTSNANPIKCAVSATTLTFTGTGTDVINYFCL